MTALFFAEGWTCLCFLPLLLLILCVPRRYPAIRHGMLAAGFAGMLLASLFARPLNNGVHNLLVGPSQRFAGQLPIRGSALPPAPEPSLTNAIRNTLKVPMSQDAAPIYSGIGYATGRIRTLGLYWLGICYGLSFLILLFSKSSKRFKETRTSRLAKVPVTLWFGKSYVILPDSADSWSADRLDRVLAHEKAHIQRWDWLWQAMANLCLVLNAFNPVVWLCVWRLRIEAEHAADQRVLADKTSASDYATDLLQIAAEARFGRNIAVVAMASRGSLKGRIRFVLSNSGPGRPSRVAACLALLAGFALPASANVLLLFGQEGPLAPVQGPINQTSRVPDVRNGLTITGDSSNGWVGKFADGTEAKLYGIWYGTKTGVVFLTPDGQPGTSPSEASWWEKGHPGRLDFVFSLPADRVKPDQDGGICSPSVLGEHAKVTIYAGGYASKSFDGTKTYIHGYLEIPGMDTNEVSLGLNFESANKTRTVTSLAELLTGNPFICDEGRVSLGHRTNAEAVCMSRTGLPKDDFGIRTEVPSDSMTTYKLRLTDDPNDHADTPSDGGCGGQEDASPGFISTQDWYKPVLKTKKYAVVDWNRYYHVDFTGIQVHWPSDQTKP